MADTKIGEAKPDPSGLWTSRVVRRDRKFYGEIRSYKRVKLAVYWAHRRTDEEFRELEAWAVDVDTIAALKSYAVTHVGILVEDGRRYLAPISLFGPAGKDVGVQVLDYSKAKGRAPGAKGKFGALQYYVPIALFKAHIPPIETREETLLERMRISARKR
jgi:hypothetical protein